MSKQFNKVVAFNYITALCKQHKIIIVKWSTTLCGRAWPEKREIKIPNPNTVERFLVALHEVGHIVYYDSNGKEPNYIEEYNCEVFALKHCLLAGFKFSKVWLTHSKSWVLMCLAKAHNRGLNHAKIPDNLRKFVEWDISVWIGCKVFVDGWSYDDLKKGKSITIELKQVGDFKNWFGSWNNVINKM